MGQKLSNIHCLLDKTMNMRKHHLTWIYLTISGANSRRCIGIAKCLRYNRGNFTRFLGKYLGYLVMSSGEGGIKVVNKGKKLKEIDDMHLVENMAEKNRSCFPIAIILTTLICSY